MRSEFDFDAERRSSVKRTQNESGALNRSLRIRLDTGEVSKYDSIFDVDLASRNWGVVASWSGDIVLTLPKEFGLRDFVLGMVEQKDATTTTFVTKKVGECHHTTLKELRAGSNDDLEFLGFVAVDIHDAQRLVTMTSSTFGKISSCTVLISDTDIVTAQHSDQDSGFTFVVEGSKTFRVKCTYQKKATTTSESI